MAAYHYLDGHLFCEEVPLASVAEAFGTPCYVYSLAELQRRASAFLDAVPESTLVCYAVKANANLALLGWFGEHGMGADVTSGGELFIAGNAGIPADKTIFSGVGKTRAEIEQAISAGVKAIHVESEAEFDVIADAAERMRKKVPIGVRVNPDIVADTHPYISTGLRAHKFGLCPEAAVTLLRRTATNPWLNPVGLAAHIGSQITDVRPYAESARFLVQMATQLADQGIGLEYLDVGGGLGIPYLNQEAPSISAWIAAATRPIVDAGFQAVIEPGRSLVGTAGLLLTRVLYIKVQGDKRFVICDAGMNDLIRPALYQAEHVILPVTQSPSPSEPGLTTADLVGPVCESSDFLARDRPLPPLAGGDLLAVTNAGAYGFAMASNYNGRLRPAEVLIQGNQHRVIRRRQTFEHLLDGC